jgi:4-amino-4-deoxy-L-arabinose transferase-like glycosyltransferase
MMTASGMETSRARIAVRAALLLFAVALVLRIAAIFLCDSLGDTSKDTWEWGYEAGCIARSLHEGHGYAGPWTRAMAPWNLGSGATGWLSPAYPAFLAQLMDLFGGVTRAMAFALFSIQAVLSAWTCVCVWALGIAVGEPRAGRLAGWILAVYPAAIWNAAHTVWDTTFVAFGLVAFLWSLFTFRRARPMAWLVLGAGFGALLLVNPAPLTAAPVVAWVLWRERESWRGMATRAFLFGLALLAVVTPWMARNQRVLGNFALRTNLGVEVMVGNNDDATGRFEIGHHPSNSAAQFERYREMGEVAYSTWAMHEGQHWIREHPARFVGLTLRRMQFFWLGEDPITDPRTDNGRRAATDLKSWIKFLPFFALGVLGLAGAVIVARRRFEGRALLSILVLFPLAYYVTHALERYRFPIDPILLLSASVLVIAVVDRRRGRAPGGEVPAA